MDRDKASDQRRTADELRDPRQTWDLISIELRILLSVARPFAAFLTRFFPSHRLRHIPSVQRSHSSNPTQSVNRDYRVPINRGLPCSIFCEETQSLFRPEVSSSL